MSAKEIADKIVKIYSVFYAKINGGYLFRFKNYKTGKYVRIQLWDDKTYDNYTYDKIINLINKTWGLV